MRKIRFSKRKKQKLSKIISRQQKLSKIISRLQLTNHKSSALQVQLQALPTHLEHPSQNQNQKTQSLLWLLSLETENAFNSFLELFCFLWDPAYNLSSIYYDLKEMKETENQEWFD